MKALAFALALVPQMGMALSCIRPDPARSFQRAQTSDERYVIAMGTFDIDPGFEQSTEGSNGEMRGAQFQTSFTGSALYRDGFRTGFSTEVDVIIACAGPWCGAVGSQEAIYFLQVTDDGYRMSAGPCGGSFAPNRDNQAILESCMAGGTCAQSN